MLLKSGFFTVKDGAFVATDQPEGGLLAKQLIAEDLSVDGSACIGADCVDGESFGFMTLKVKENNARLMFQDTSNTGTFPSNDWALAANDSENGGANSFMIQDCGTGSTECDSTTVTTPFTLMAGAPENAVFISEEGRLGLGTSTPAVNIQTVHGNTPTLRLEQDGSEGFSEQAWDVAGNEANFFIRDVTNSSKLPFRILAGAPDDALVIDAAGEVGIGTDQPSAQLDVDGDIAVTGLVDGRDIAAAGSTLDAHVADFDNPHQVTAEQVGADTAGTAESLLADHVAALHDEDPSGLPIAIAEGGTGATDAVTALSNLGAVSQVAFDVHADNLQNPHQVTAIQVGADPSGTADAAVAAALAAYDHANIPSELPVPLAQGGTGASDLATARANLGITDDPTKVGIVAQSEFSSGPVAQATVTFSTPFEAGTSYVVTMTGYSTVAVTTFAPTLLSKDENGFTISLGTRSNRLVEVNWIARPVTE